MLEIKKGYHKSFNLDGVEYYVRNNRYGFGYEIMTKTSVDGMTKYHCYYRNTDKELVKKVFMSIAENEKLPETLPMTCDGRVPKVLILETKHHRYHYKVDTIEELEKVARHILKERADEGRYWNPYDNKPTKNAIGFNSLEEIEKLGAGNVKYYAEQEWKKYQRDVQNQKKYENNWDNLQLVLEGKGLIGNVMSALETYESQDYDLEDLYVVE